MPELANAERPEGDRPTSRDEGSPDRAGHWHGSATSHVLAWKRRALRAEGHVHSLLAELQAHGWRPHT